MRLKFCFFFVLLVFFNLQLKATHLVGGFISYQYVQQGSFGTRYIITITSYRDCKPQSADFQDDIDVCFFKQNDNRFLKSEQFSIVSRGKVQPLGRTDCPEATSMCLERAIYRKTVDLPNNNAGYYVRWETCCRNVQVNLRDDNGDPYIGQTYETLIPATNIKNSSPFFTDVPVPFICINDTTEINNYAIDTDGDSLVYKLATPWYGTDPSNIFRDCQSSYSPPTEIDLSDYQTGYSGVKPFGPSGVSLINSKNGVTTFMGTRTGNYAVAIDLFEYRNGKLLSKTRLDLQILVINCNPNNKPAITNSTKTYYVNAGDKLCFNVTATDKDNHNIQLKGIGDIFTGANGFQGNRATLNDVNGKGFVSSEFCWQTECRHASNDPYVFTVNIIDDGCPSKFAFTNFYIYVLPPSIKVTVNGPPNVCQGSTNNYTIVPSANDPKELINATYEVTVRNGILKSQSGTNLTITWNNNLTKGYIDVIPTNQFGCKGKLYTYEVNLISSPPIPTLLSRDTVCPNSIEIYTTPNTPGNTYKWFLSNGNAISATNLNSITINWLNPGKAFAKLIQINNINCPSDTALLDVWVSKPSTPNLVGSKTICPYNKNIEYFISNPINGLTYQWVVVGGTIKQNLNSTILVDWGDVGLGYVKAVVVDKFGCSSDTGYLPVNKTHALIANAISGDTSICEFTRNQVYQTIKSKNNTYNWSIVGGIITSGQGTNIINVDWGSTNTGSLSMYETSYDSVNNLPCISNVTTRTINIRKIPDNKIIIGDFEHCQINDSTILNVVGLPNSSFTWFINNNTNNISGQGSNTIKFPLTQFGTFKIRVIEISEYNCIGAPIDTTILIHPKPTTSPILGDSIICFPNLLNYKYTTSGFANSSFEWNVNSGTITNPNNGNSINVNWTGIQNNTVTVLETSEFGCKGDTQKLNVFYDNPRVILDYITVNPPPGADNGINLFWHLVNAPRYNKNFIIERRNSGTGDPFTQVGTVNGSTVTFNNTPLNTDNNSFEYRVKGYDLCGQEIITNVHQNILLTGTKVNGYDVTMNFTPYLGWNTANIQYDLYRQLKNKTGYELYESNIQSFDASYSNGLDHYTQCYRVKATKIGTDTVSWSNDICFNFDPVLFIPNAFSPNRDDFNDLFVLKGGALSALDFKIYNRWGEKLFESKDLSDKWDGKYKDKDVPQDVYVYYCIYYGFDGRKYSTKGTITLLR